jgi:hypothetical protein
MLVCGACQCLYVERANACVAQGHKDRGCMMGSHWIERRAGIMWGMVQHQHNIIKINGLLQYHTVSHSITQEKIAQENTYAMLTSCSLSAKVDGQCGP